ncbi:hypothetical protein DL95DRAFT_398063 [Leptodontidium sp. 2 PMI_412]|nr:hypothetical protein DL95DRAFT_398063 [Leptodontidium sp. 2 PMI_412]
MHSTFAFIRLFVLLTDRYSLYSYHFHRESSHRDLNLPTLLYCAPRGDEPSSSLMPLLRSKQAEISILIDSGTSVLTATTLSTIGKALIAMLNHANGCLVSAKV